MNVTNEALEIVGQKPESNSYTASSYKHCSPCWWVMTNARWMIAKRGMGGVMTTPVDGMVTMRSPVVTQSQGVIALTRRVVTHTRWVISFNLRVTPLTYLMVPFG